MLQLDRASARALIVAAQGLDHLPAAPATQADVLAAIRRLGALQIDTIHVVARSPYLALFSRLGQYDPAWLDELLAQGALFEYWAHAACFLPIEDYSLHRHRMIQARGPGWLNDHYWVGDHHEVAEQVVAYLRERGEARSADFERTQPGNGWWDWKPEKRALEALLNVGEVMVARRERFQRVYALRERLLPDWDDNQATPESEAQSALTARAVQAWGVAQDDWVHEYFRLTRAGVPVLLEGLLAEGTLVEAQVEGWRGRGLVHVANLPLAERAARGALTLTRTTLLSPFDSLLWHRKRVQSAFDMDYTIECYLPAPKRRYGYFCLPILRRGELVGRADCKAHRGEKRFAVKALYLESGVVVDGALCADLAGALAECARWHSTPQVAMERVEPPELEAPLRAALAAILIGSY